MRAPVAGLLALSLVSGLALAKPKPAAPSPTVNSRVAVAIVVDQFAAWIADERLPLLPPTGGFAKLRREGTWIHRSEYPYGLTETAPGHAALFTGRLPRDNGIVANVVWRSDLGKSTSLIEDKSAKFLVDLADAPKLAGRNGASLALVKAPTIGNRLLDAEPNATIISISLKDRGAIFAAPSPVAEPGGTKARGPSPRVQVVWQDESTGVAVGSDKITDRLPEWAKDPDPGPDPFVWRLEHEAFVKRYAATEDSQPGEDDGMNGGTPRSFPHAFPHGTDPKSWDAFWRRYRATPAGDKWIVDRAVAALASRCGAKVDSRGRCPLDGPLLLAVSFSTNDYVGHRFGPDSYEAWEELASLDEQLARLFAELDRRFGAGGYTVALSADHGVGPLPEVLGSDLRRPSNYELPRKEDGEGVRLDAEGMESALEKALEAFPEVPKDHLVAVDDTIVSVRRDLFDSLHSDQQEIVRRTIRETLSQVEGVRTVYDLDEDICRPGRHRDRDEIYDLVRNSTRCENGKALYGMFYVVTDRGAYFIRRPYTASHATIYRYDRTVPLLVRYADGIARSEVGGGTFESFSRALWVGLTGR